MVQICRFPRDARIDRADQRHQRHADQRAAMLDAGQLRRLARREAEHRAGERLEDQVLRAVGQHRDEDEDRKAPRLAARSRPRQALRGMTTGAAAPSIADDRGCRIAFDAPDANQREHHRRDRYRPETTIEPARRERIEQMAGDAGGDDEAGDHHDPDDGRRRRAALVVGALGEQHQQRRAGRADADADQTECDHRQARCRTADASPSTPSPPTPSSRRSRAPPCRRRSTACAARRDRSRSPRRGRNTCKRIVQGDQRARQHRRHAPVRPPSRGSASKW